MDSLKETEKREKVLENTSQESGAWKLTIELSTSKGLLGEVKRGQSVVGT